MCSVSYVNSVPVGASISVLRYVVVALLLLPLKLMPRYILLNCLLYTKCIPASTKVL